MEVLAVLLYRGEIELLEQLFKKQNPDIDFFVFLINEINGLSTLIPPYNLSKIQKRLAQEKIGGIMTKHL